ncbi:MAG: DUF1127 domain-containing protein [Rhodobacterales bacterium]|nr:DUF1127 domain-containing protein [Rhodobacterales bacterium]
MTTLSTNTLSLGSSPSFVQDVLARLRVRAAGLKAYDKTYHELSRMTARDLADIGLSVGMIDDVALQAAEMARTTARNAA